MAGGIFPTYLMLMAIITLNQPLPSSEKKTISPEDEEEAVQRMKEREVTLLQHQLHLEKEVADIEARQASLAWPLWELERKIRWHTCTVLCLVVPVMFMIWRQRRNGGTGEYGEEETELGLLGKAWKGVTLLTKPSVLFRAIYRRKVFYLVVPVVFRIWRQRWNGGTGEHREEETELGLLGKAWKGVTLLAKPTVLFIYRAIYTRIVFCLVVPVVVMIWRQCQNGGIGEDGEEETEPGLLGKAWKGVAFLTRPFVLLIYRVIYFCVDRIIDYFVLVVDRLLEILLKLLRSRKKKLVHDIP